MEEIRNIQSSRSRRETTQKERENQISQAVSDLFLKPPKKSFICTNPPRSVRHNRAFIVDTTNQAVEEDLLADDCGVWLNNGQPFFYFEQSGEDKKEFTRAGRGGMVDEHALQKPWLVVHRIYYVNKSFPQFRRTITFIKV